MVEWVTHILAPGDKMIVVNVAIESSEAVIAQHAPKGSQAYFYDASEVSPPGG